MTLEHKNYIYKKRPKCITVEMMKAKNTQFLKSVRKKYMMCLY